MVVWIHFIYGSMCIYWVFPFCFHMYRLIIFFFVLFLCSSIHYVRQSAKEMPIFFYSGYYSTVVFFMLYYFCCLFIATNSVLSFFISISSIHRVLCNFLLLLFYDIQQEYFLFIGNKKQENKTYRMRINNI